MGGGGGVPVYSGIFLWIARHTHFAITHVVFSLCVRCWRILSVCSTLYLDQVCMFFFQVVAQ